MAYAFIPLLTQPGVNPAPDSTAFATPLFTVSTGIRFYNGMPEKIGGWQSFIFDMGNTISGTPRMVYSQRISNTLWTMIGTNTRLYSLAQTTLTNITPLVASTTTIANSLATNYTTLGSNPITTINGSSTLTIAHVAHKVQAGDNITLSGASTTNGVPSGNINTTQVVRSTTANSYTISVATPATSGGSGGGASVVEATGIITVTQAAHGFSNGDRVKILAATATGGVTAPQINLEFVIRGVTTNTYDLATAGTATSSVTGGGGASTTVQGQIAAGSADQLAGIGYGVGKYGIGLYGTSKTSSTLQVYPRLWIAGNFGNNMMLTPGNQTGLYQWLGDITVAPTLLTNAPTAINYVFINNDIIVTLGAANTPNRIQWSDLGNSTIWTPTAQNQAGQVDVQGASQFLSHAELNGTVVLFTADQIYTFTYIGLPFVWQITKITNGQGLIAQNARIVVDGIVYWMSINGFYMYDGSVVKPIPSNIAGQSSVKEYVLNNLNYAQQSKIFFGYTEEFNEIDMFYPSASSNECDKVIRLNLTDFTWTPDILSRSAFEYPYVRNANPKIINITGTLYNHEIGVDADGSALNWSLATKVYWQQWDQNGTNVTEIGGIVPDSIQAGAINLAVTTLPYTQSQITSDKTPTTNNYTINPNTTILDLFENGRMFQYTMSQTGVIGGNWRMGQWLQLMQPGPLDG